ncbi:radical SAM protein [Candidatus Woesearchaeota archaeon]|nr:radical SAM protein [Candidatus Woesearchaeota archaeon]
MIKKIQKTKFNSYKIGSLAKGCQQCIKGEKTVLLITGLCSKNCFFCPISDQKKNKDVIYFNEWSSRQINDLFTEITLCGSKGVGITGGDPLIKLERTIKFIKALKKRFGEKFHIHLYTPLELVADNKLKKLFNAGLDEIRFHLDVYNSNFWEKITLAEKYGWDIGVEVPVIPGIEKQYKKMIDFLCNKDKKRNKIKFLNLNELEISDTNACKLVEKGFRAKDKYSYGVKGSEELSKKLLKYIFTKKYKLNVHYCTCKLKDNVQLRNRIKKRSKNAAKPYDIVDEEGMLIRGAIYYHNGTSLKCIINVLKQNNVPKKYYGLDKKRKRLLTTTVVVEKLVKELKKCSKSIKIAIVKEYPTVDSLNVETDFL